MIRVGEVERNVSGTLTKVDGVPCYRIDGVEAMDPFLMTVVSDSDLWMFVSSTGALTAGRVDADHALFPYETDDRIHRAAGLTGPVTVVARTVDGQRELWRPFGPETTPGARRSIAKSTLGDRLTFEERHREWGVGFRSTWAPSSVHGWVRTVELFADAHHDDVPIELEVLDGFLDVMPAGVDAHTEQVRSNLVDAYKRSEAGPWGRLAVYSLESLVTDRAEPAESLAATVVWSTGLEAAELDLGFHGVADMIAGRPSRPSTLVTGQPGAYLLRGSVSVALLDPVSWMLVADTGLGHAAVQRIVLAMADDDAVGNVRRAMVAGSQALSAVLEAADGVQSTADAVADAHHLSNVLFNSMRGGVFPYGHRIPSADLARFFEDRNRVVFERRRGWLASLGEWVDVTDLRAAADETADPDVIRLVLEYLPLTFSRRHGDPSRPWNRFSITVHDDSGAQVLSYEGNWRDIFQNWEALLHSYPAFIENVIAKFVNASTIDGYNAYRISRRGIEWEVPDPADPWSHIGYWGDHQIVYLLRLLDALEQYRPGAIRAWANRDVFVYADVPYLIADHDAMVRDPRNTIAYDEYAATAIAGREERVGSDGRLLVDGAGDLVRVTLVEKLLVPALAKLAGLVPGGGIWLNTQRPEWNDANNALAGPGLSVVTLCHLRRYLVFLVDVLDGVATDTTRLSTPVAAWLSDMLDVVAELPPSTDVIDDAQRRTILDELGRAASTHRRRVASGVGGAVVVATTDIRRLCDRSGAFLDDSIRAARRDDGLYHSYNLVSFPDEAHAGVDHLGPTLEGQVAVLSSGALDGEASLAVIDALFASDLYRADQDTFMLYPAIALPSFLARNVISTEAESRLGSLLGPLNEDLRSILERGPDRRWHFRPGIANAVVLGDLLEQTPLGEADRQELQEVYEETFDHHSFTGRSGSMYGYEGIGSVYWHMVAKLLLAVQEAYWTAIDSGESDDVVARLVVAYRRIRTGLGFRKDPVAFGAIPTDCYSHTPAHAGAQQPGMTGQVKEEMLTRRGELGIRVCEGRLRLSPGLVPSDEILGTDARSGRGLARFSVCGVPMSLGRGSVDSVTVVGPDTRETSAGLALSYEQSRDVFARGSTVTRIEWTVGEQTLARWS